MTHPTQSTLVQTQADSVLLQHPWISMSSVCSADLQHLVLLSTIPSGSDNLTLCSSTVGYSSIPEDLSETSHLELCVPRSFSLCTLSGCESLSSQVEGPLPRALIIMAKHCPHGVSALTFASLYFLILDDTEPAVSCSYLAPTLLWILSLVNCESK